MSESADILFEEDELEDLICAMEKQQLLEHHDEMDECQPNDTINEIEDSLDKYMYHLDEEHRKNEEEERLNDYMLNLDEEHQKEKEAEESLNDDTFFLDEEHRKSKCAITLTRKEMITALIDKCQFTVEKAEWITNTLQDLITEEC